MEERMKELGPIEILNIEDDAAKWVARRISDLFAGDKNLYICNILLICL